MARARVKSVTVAQSATTRSPTHREPPTATPAIEFDFEGRARSCASAAPPAGETSSPRDGSIKEAIVRWLNEQL